jgi:sugar phosphate isomerase/epimerase
MYTVRDAMQTPQDSVEAFKRVAETGYRVVELAGYGGLEVAELARVLGDLGLTACSSHNDFAELRDNPESVAEGLLALGCEQVVSGPPKRPTSEQEWVEFARQADPVARRLSELGLTYAYHNHSFELEKFGERTALAILYEESDPAYVRAQLDTYWIQHGGGNPVVWIERLGDRLPTLHMKDMTMHGSEQFFAEVGEGNMDWPGIIAAARRAGVQRYIVEQDICERDPFDSIAMSLRNMQEMGLE